MQHLHRPAGSARHPGAKAKVRGGGKPVAASPGRPQWVQAFAARLQALRPEIDANGSLVLAEELWRELGSQDPEMAAEMEHESRRDE